VAKAIGRWPVRFRRRLGPNAGKHSYARLADRAFPRCLSAVCGLRRSGSTPDYRKNSGPWAITLGSEESNWDSVNETSQTCSERIRSRSTHGSETTANPHYACFRRFGPFSDMIWRTCRATRRSGSGSLPNAEDWDFRRRRSPGLSDSMRQRSGDGSEGRADAGRSVVFGRSSCDG
jgi:hypothetical protein